MAEAGSTRRLQAYMCVRGGFATGFATLLLRNARGLVRAAAVSKRKLPFNLKLAIANDSRAAYPGPGRL